jgi:hypothetical protein
MHQCDLPWHEHMWLPSLIHVVAFFADECYAGPCVYVMARQVLQ